MTVVTGAWMLVLLNLPRAFVASRNWLKASKDDERKRLAGVQHPGA